MEAKPHPLGQGLQEFRTAFLEVVQQAIDALAELPRDIGRRYEETVDEIADRFERRMQQNLSALFGWTGIPSVEQIEELAASVDRLANRLDAIERQVKALEAHPKDQPWPEPLPEKPRRTRRRSSAS